MQNDHSNPGKTRSEVRKHDLGVDSNIMRKRHVCFAIGIALAGGLAVGSLCGSGHEGCHAKAR
jgi:hypothetical protein